MSLEINLYVQEIDDSVIPEWLLELNKLGMSCEIHPDFSFSDHSGFLPWKIKISKGTHEAFLNETYLTGFELYIADFDFVREFGPPKKQSFLAKLFNKSEANAFFAGPEIDGRLKICKKVIGFYWGSSDAFELRMAALASATLAKITGGVCCYPADDLWYDNDTIVQEQYDEISEYEKSLNPDECTVHMFKEWY